MGVEAIFLDRDGHGEDVGLSGFLPSPWSVFLPFTSPVTLLDSPDLQVDGNLYWHPGALDKQKAGFFTKYRASPAYERSKKAYPPGFDTNSLVADPIWDEFEDEDVLFEFPPGKDRILASYHAGRELAAYVEPVAVGDRMPDMPLFLFDGLHIKVPLEATYQTTWSALPAELQTIVETGVMPVAPEE
jgi:hypothetical protein